MSIVRVILAGERDCITLAHEASANQEQRAGHPQVLEGDYREEHLFALQTALELYDSYQFKIMECDQHVEKAIAAFEAKMRASAPDLSRLRSADKRQEALQCHYPEEMAGADLTKLPGLDLLTVQRILSEIGLDMSRWPSEKHFRAPPTLGSAGGKVLSRKPRKKANRAAAALRLAAQSAMQSKPAMRPSSKALNRVLERRRPSTPAPTNSLGCSIALFRARRSNPLFIGIFIHDRLICSRSMLRAMSRRS
jgi:transposase